MKYHLSLVLSLWVSITVSGLAFAQEADDQPLQTASAPTQPALESWRPSIVDKAYRAKRRQDSAKVLQKNFEWWPTDAKPGAVKDEERGGYWWWPTTPGKVKPWGNRGYVYVYKIIFDYQEDRLPPAKPNELRPSLLVRRVIKNVKVYFDYDKASLREDAKVILNDGIRSLKKNPKASVLVTGNTDVRGPESYNMKLATQRAEAVRDYMVENGISADRIRLVSRGKLNASAPVTDIVGMQKDRNAQFMVADVDEVMLPYQGPPQGVESEQVDKDRYVMKEQQTLESTIQVATREYTIQDGDTLSKIAREQLGGAHRWIYLYNFNKDRIKDADRLNPGDQILIPVE